MKKTVDSFIDPKGLSFSEASKKLGRVRYKAVEDAQDAGLPPPVVQKFVQALGLPKLPPSADFAAHMPSSSQVSAHQAPPTGPKSMRHASSQNAVANHGQQTVFSGQSNLFKKINHGLNQYAKKLFTDINYKLEEEAIKTGGSYPVIVRVSAGGINPLSYAELQRAYQNAPEGWDRLEMDSKGSKALWSLEPTSSRHVSSYSSKRDMDYSVKQLTDVFSLFNRMQQEAKVHTNFRFSFEIIYVRRGFSNFQPSEFIVTTSPADLHASPTAIKQA